jgi:hypothetical protein
MFHFRSRKFTTLTQFTRSSRSLIVKKITEGKEEDTKSYRGTDDFFVPRIIELLYLRTFVPRHAELTLVSVISNVFICTCMLLSLCCLRPQQ